MGRVKESQVLFLCKKELSVVCPISTAMSWGGDVVGVVGAPPRAERSQRTADHATSEVEALVLKTAETVAALTRIPQTDDAQLHSEYTVNYSGNDFVRAVVACIGALAPACVTRP